MQSICSIHQIFFEIHLILEFRDLKSLAHFEHNRAIIIKLTFSFPKFVSVFKKSADLINSFLRYI